MAGDWLAQPNIQPMTPSFSAPALRVTLSSHPYATAPTIGPQRDAAPPRNMISRNTIEPASVSAGVSGLAAPVRITETEPAAAAIAAAMPNMSVLVRVRFTPITAAAVSLSRIAISERPTRLRTMPRLSRKATNSTITATQ